MLDVVLKGLYSNDENIFTGPGRMLGDSFYALDFQYFVCWMSKIVVYKGQC